MGGDIICDGVLGKNYMNISDTSAMSALIKGNLCHRRCDTNEIDKLSVSKSIKVAKQFMTGVLPLFLLPGK